MSKTRKWNELREQVLARPGAGERLAQLRQETLAEIGLHELRSAQQLTQTALAARLHIRQPAVSKVEHADDVLVSTLRDYIGALGGRLELRAVFDGREPVHITIGANDTSRSAT